MGHVEDEPNSAARHGSRGRAPRAASSVERHRCDDLLWHVTHTAADRTECVSVDEAGNCRQAGHADVSDDGRFVTFYSTKKLTADATEGARQIYVRDLLEPKQTFLISKGYDGRLADPGARPGRISGDGRFVTMSVLSNEMVTDDPHDSETSDYDVFIVAVPQE